MSFILTQLQNAESGSKEYLEIIDIPSTEPLVKNVNANNRIKNPAITFDDVSFSYESGQQILEHVSFELKPKQTVALIGHSGAGKTTIINLILKLYPATQGVVKIGGKPYDSVDTYALRNTVSLVFQDNEVFSSTVLANVSYGSAHATEKEIIQALKLAHAYDFVMKLPHGVNSEIGERGVKLSGGQKQRIQIARAILKNAPILILDEATSSLDAQSEREVQHALEALMKDKLVIIIAHRFSTIQNADTILVVENGKIIDQGSPSQLAQRDGIYKDLLRYQIEGNKKLLAGYDIF
jgi:ATP-binding cassette subfamily B protein